MRFLFIFCTGVGATLAWQTYGDQARQIIVGSYPQLAPQLAWIAPRAASVATAATAAPARSGDPQLQELSLGLAAVRQRIDQLAFQQEQMTRDISARVQAAERDILDKIAAAQPKPEVTAARRPASATPQTQSTQLR
jgi:small-conductance mechanosensitive channel